VNRFQFVFQFVADHQPRYGVKRLCQAVGVARSSFCYWRSTAADRAARDAADLTLAGQIKTVHAAHDGTYGAPRITAELRGNGHRVNHKRVARVMRRFGVQGLRLRRRQRTTIADPAAAKAPDLIGRDFTAPAPNQRYVGDITYLPVGERGFLYLATVLDLHSRRLAGWAIADHMRTDLVLDALAAAGRTRGSLAGAVLHTDHGARAVHVSGLRRRLPHGRRASVDERDRQLGRQRRGRVVQRQPQTRNAARPACLHQRTRSPANDVSMATPLQHRPAPLPARTPAPDHLREQHNGLDYPGPGRITPCPRSGVKPPSGSVGSEKAAHFWPNVRPSPDPLHDEAPPQLRTGPRGAVDVDHRRAAVTPGRRSVPRSGSSTDASGAASRCSAFRSSLTWSAGFQ
jgi:HTH-like domain/Integrase core domain